MSTSSLRTQAACLAPTSPDFNFVARASLVNWTGNPDDPRNLRLYRRADGSAVLVVDDPSGDQCFDFFVPRDVTGDTLLPETYMNWTSQFNWLTDDAPRRRPLPPVIFYRTTNSQLIHIQCHEAELSIAMSDCPKSCHSWDIYNYDPDDAFQHRLVFQRWRTTFHSRAEAITAVEREIRHSLGEQVEAELPLSPSEQPLPPPPAKPAFLSTYLEAFPWDQCFEGEFYGGPPGSGISYTIEFRTGDQPGWYASGQEEEGSYGFESGPHLTPHAAWVEGSAKASVK